MDQQTFRRVGVTIDKVKDLFISTINHELRTPLTTIISGAELLKDTPLNKGQTEIISAIDASSCLLLALINDVLDYSKLHAGKLSVEKQPFSPILPQGPVSGA